MSSVRALTLLPLILSTIAHPVSLTPRDDPSTFIQDTSPFVDNPKLSMDGDEMFSDSFAIPYLYPSSSSSPSSSSTPSSSSSSPLSSPWPSQSVIHGISQSVNPSVTPSYTPWAPTPVNTKPVNADTTPTPVLNSDQPTPALEKEKANAKPTNTETNEFDDNDDDNDSFSKMWDILSGRIRHVLDSDEFTLWD